MQRPGAGRERPDKPEILGLLQLVGGMFRGPWLPAFRFASGYYADQMDAWRYEKTPDNRLKPHRSAASSTSRRWG